MRIDFPCRIFLLYRNINELLPYIPILPIGAFGAAILLSVVLAYAMGSRMLRKEGIVDVLKDESV